MYMSIFVSNINIATDLDIFPGIVRGCGRQQVGAYVNLSAYYIVGIPAALCFAFVYHLGGMVIY
jgi:MATE family multidrug resistance protein